jgi:hypothetical protein
VKKKHHVLSNLNYAFYEYRNVLDYSNYPEKVDWRGIHKGSKSIQWEANYSFVHEKFELRFLYRFDQTEVKYQNNFERMHFVPKHNFVGALHLFHQRNKDISSIEGQRMEWNTRVSGHFDIAHPEQISIPNALILLHSRLILPMDYFRKREFLLSACRKKALPNGTTTLAFPQFMDRQHFYQCGFLWEFGLRCKRVITERLPQFLLMFQHEKSLNEKRNVHGNIGKLRKYLIKTFFYKISKNQGSVGFPRWIDGLLQFGKKC